MKKIFFAALAALAVFASCNKDPKPVPEPKTGIEITSQKIVDLGESSFSTITFTAYDSWTATVYGLEEEAPEYVKLDKAEGEKGAQSIKVTIGDLPEETYGRAFSVVLTPKSGNPDAVNFLQGKVFYVQTLSDLPVGVEGGKVQFGVVSNCKYELKKYDGAEEAFPWAPVSIEKTNEVSSLLTFDVQPNDTYVERQAYVKFTVNDIVVDDQPAVYRVYVDQTCNECKAYSLSMYDMQFDTWGTNVISEAIYNGKHYVCNGQDLFEINPATGEYLNHTSLLESFAYTQKVITNDDAGNMIVCNHTSYDGAGGYVDGYFMLSVVKADGTALPNIITEAAYLLGGPFGARLSVKGDITKKAIIVAAVEGIEGITGSNTIGYWEVADGKVGTYKTVSVTGFTGIGWMAGYWCAYPSNHPSVVAKGLTCADGFVMSGVYDENNIYSVNASGDATMILSSMWMEGEYDLSGNVSLQSIDVKNIGGKNYLVALASSFFPSYGPGWSGSPRFAIHDLDAIKEYANVYDNSLFNKIIPGYFPWEEDPATDWTISVAADVNLYDAGGKIGVAIADLNGRCVDAYELDPAKF